MATDGKRDTKEVPEWCFEARVVNGSATLFITIAQIQLPTTTAWLRHVT